jgi:hypothetical protein
VVDDISREGLRDLLREEGASFQRIKTWKASRDPDYAVKKARVEHLYAIADGEVIPEDDDPAVVFCLDEFGPLNLMPHPGWHWAAMSGKNKDPTGTAPSPPRHLQPQRRRPASARCLRPDPRPTVRARQDPQEAHPVPGVLPLPAQPVSAGRALRYFALDGTGHRSHKEQGSMIRRCIIWRNRHAGDTRLRQVVARASVA